VHALRRLALPSTVGLIETSGGQEDVQSFGWEAAEALRRAIRHGHAVTSCELLTAYRAVTLSPDPVPPGCRALIESLTGVIGPIEADRPFGEDIERLTAASWPSGPGAE
jgi:histidine ammonia-lyase